MVGLPLLIGSKSVASRYVSPAQPIEVFDDDDDDDDDDDRPKDDINDDGPSILYPSTLISSCYDDTDDINVDDDVHSSTGRNSSSKATIVTARSSDQELLAVITIYYYNMMRRRQRHRRRNNNVDSKEEIVEEQEVAYCVAELHIQISFVGQTTSITGRDSIHRIPLRRRRSNDYQNHHCSTTSQENTDHPTLTIMNIQSMAIFSSDRRYLSCLIVHPSTTASTLVVFQLRKPKVDTTKLSSLKPPPLPPYIIPSKITLPILPVATNPRIVPNIHNATTLCHWTSCHHTSRSMLIGCGDGSVYYVNHMYHRPFIATRVTLLQSDCNDTILNSLLAPIMVLDHCIIDDDDGAIDDDDDISGRLVVVGSDGNIRIYQSRITHEEPPLQKQPQHHHQHLNNDNDHPNQNSETTLIPEESESESHRQWDMNLSDRSVQYQQQQHHQNHSARTVIAISDRNYHRGFQLHPIHDFQKDGILTLSTFRLAKWINSSYLIIIEEPKNMESTIHVFGMHNNNFIYPLSTMTMTKSLLEESTDSIINFDHERYTVRQRPLVVLDYDPYSACVAVTSYIGSPENNNKSRRQQFYSFSCLWNWRVNVLGYTTCHAPQRPDESILTVSNYFAMDHVQQRKLVCVSSIYNSIQQTNLIQKESYDMALLSPPYERSNHNTRPNIRESTVLLLSANSISYPVIASTSYMKNYEMDWMESRIPQSYLSTYGAPSLATIGKRYGRSMAVASTRGFCVLDRSIDFHMTTTTTNMAKWRLFANESHEKQFRVVAFQWWEGSMRRKNQTKIHQECFEDILVAVIETLDTTNRADNSDYFLSCWSVRNIELSAQLLQSTLGAGDGETTTPSICKWGLKLPPDFIPTGIDILAQPNPLTNCDDDGATISCSEQRIAAVMITDGCRTTTNYRIYQLRLDNNTTSTVNLHNIHVTARCTAFGRIGSAAQLFVASSSFTPIHKDRGDNCTDGEYTVIGAIQKTGNGLDAFLVSSATILNYRPVVESSDKFSNTSSRSEIAQYWLSDIVYDNVCDTFTDPSNSFEWIFQLTDGRLVNWSIPFSFSINETDPPFQQFVESESNNVAKTVNQKSPVLGIVTPAGSATNWMQQSTRGVQSNFLGGTVPRSAFGYIVGTNQSNKNIITNVGENMNGISFRANIHQHTVLRPGDLMLYPPTYLPSLHVRAVELPDTKVRYNESSYPLEKYVRTKMVSLEQQDMAVLSLQLIILRLVERLVKLAQSGNSDIIPYSRFYDRLANIVALVRKCSTPLQFAIFFITLARQMEISSLQHLFPLPETIDDLYNIAALYGSIPTAVSTLPILTDQRSTRMKCTDMFHVSVDRLDGIFQQPLHIDFDIGMDELYSVGEIFRYSLKINDNLVGKHFGLGGDGSDSDDDVPTRTFSIMCGMSKRFGLGTASSKKVIAAKKSDETPLLIHGITDNKITKLKDYGVKHIRPLSLWQNQTSVATFTNVPQVSARFIVSSIFGGDIVDSQIGWIKVALLSTTVMCDMSSEKCFSTIHKFSHLIETIKVNRFLALAPLDVRREGMLHALEYFIRHCHDGIDPDVANDIYELVLVLLFGCCDTTTFMADVPGLILVAVVAAHKANRILDILSPENDDTLSIAYFELYAKLDSW